MKGAVGAGQASSLLQSLAKSEIDYLQQSRGVLLDQHSHSFKWLTGSLLAINGAGAVAVLNTAALFPEDKILSGIFFGAGILFALLIGVFSQRANQRMLVCLQEAIGYWVQVENLGFRNENREKDLREIQRKSVYMNMIGQVCGWISGCLFFVGFLMSGMALTEAAHGSVRRTNNIYSANVDGSHGTQWSHE